MQLADSLGLKDKVAFHGSVSDEELAKAYARARLFVMPSNKEGFGIVFLEAWLHGLPGDLRLRGGIQGNCIRRNRWLRRGSGNVDGLAEKIELLLSNNKRAREMGERGYKKVTGFYLDEHFRSNLSELLQSLPTT